ncbi:MAG: TauD/TfdA family dioxygenase [Pseudomonadota bacterium]
MQTLKMPQLSNKLPPKEITGPSAWYGRDMRKTDAWMFRLSKADIGEIESAVEASRKLRIQDIGKAEFPLPKLGPRLDALMDELLDGRGFTLIRGLPMDRFDTETAARAYWGLGRYLGDPRSQNAKGDLLGHVTDVNRTSADVTARLYQTSEKLYFHPDSTDIVGLLCLRQAMTGGGSSVVSSVTVYNEMQKRRPDLAEVLLRPVCIDRRSEVPEGKKPWFEMPIFNWHQGLLTTNYTRPYILSAQRFEGVPRLTPAQIEAIDYLHELCEDPELHLDMDFEPGDMQFLQNWQTMHNRTAYQDWPEPERRRHLLRLWLCTPRGRELPPAFGDRNLSIKIGDRGGIVVPSTRFNVTLEVS